MTPARSAIRRFAHTPAASPAADRILIIRLGALGDVVRTLPAVEAIRDHYAEAQVAWLVEPRAAAVLHGQKAIDEILVFPRDVLSRDLRAGRWFAAGRTFYSFVRELREGRFGLVLDFHSILKSGILARLSGSSQRVALGPPEGREFSWLFANRVVPGDPTRRSRFERNAAMARFLGINDEVLRGYRFEATEESRLRIEKSWGDRPNCIAIHPGASPGKSYKRYAAQHYGEVARLLWRSQGVRSLVIRGADPDEHDLARTVVEASGGAAELAPETDTASDLAALLARCRIFIGADTGPLHLAALVGTPVVQLLGPTDPVQNTPFEGTPSLQLRVPIACSPCRRGCATAPCMALLSPRRVFDAAEELLAGFEQTACPVPMGPPRSPLDRSRAGIG